VPRLRNIRTTSEITTHRLAVTSSQIRSGSAGDGAFTYSALRAHSLSNLEWWLPRCLVCDEAGHFLGEY
jgi:hypothetical protein